MSFLGVRMTLSSLFQNFRNVCIPFSLTFLVLGCAGAQKSPEKEAEANQVKSLEEQVQQLSASLSKVSERLDAIDHRMTLVQDQVRSQGEELHTSLSAKFPKAKAAKVPTHPASGVGKKAQITAAPSDPEAGLQSDEAIQRFRSAMALYDGKKYSQSVLEFSNFVRDFADHSLAAAAQFYTGEAYRAQGELKLATEEYKRILISYERSSYLKDALKRLVDCFESLKITEEAATHRATLQDLFPEAVNTNTAPAAPAAPSSPEISERSPSSFPTADPTPLEAHANNERH